MLGFLSITNRFNADSPSNITETNYFSDISFCFFKNKENHWHIKHKWIIMFNNGIKRSVYRCELYRF